MTVTRGGLLRWQFDLTWSLMELHVERLEPADFLWEPSALCWTVRPAPDGRWVPDWREPDPVPVPTIGWLTWHIGWWWTVAIAHAQGAVPPERTEAQWPGSGSATVDWLRELRADWHAALDRLTDTDLDRVAPFPWRDDPERTVGHMIGWVNSELMKNAAEIGQLRLPRAVSEG